VTADAILDRLKGEWPVISESWLVTAYAPNYRRLQQIKTAYDPENFFRMNQNIPPRS
jgi:FAD/FMN-containing dehydrogenase